MSNRNRILWITRSALFIAMLVVIQIVTVPLGNTIITGTLVNTLLIMAVLTSGLNSGLTVAIVSPIIAKFFGIGPFWALIPFIILGNITLILIWHFICNKNRDNKYVLYIIAAITGAIAKFIVLYVGITKIALPFILNLPAKQASVISNIFSIPQLITALIGGVIVIILLPALKNAFTNNS